MALLLMSLSNILRSTDHFYAKLHCLNRLIQRCVISKKSFTAVYPRWDVTNIKSRIVLSPGMSPARFTRQHPGLIKGPLQSLFSAFCPLESFESSLPAVGTWQVFASVYESAEHVSSCLEIKYHELCCVCCASQSLNTHGVWRSEAYDKTYPF